MRLTFRATAKKEDSPGTGTFIRIPGDVSEAFGIRKRAKVVVTINGEPYRTTLMVRAGKHIVAFPAAYREAARIEPEARLDVTIEPDLTPRTVEVPAELAAELANAPDLNEYFESLSYTHRKEYVQWIDEAKKPETRDARVAKMIVMLRDTIETPG